MAFAVLSPVNACPTVSANERMAMRRGINYEYPHEADFSCYFYCRWARGSVVGLRHYATSG
jgi:hypothetical protein